MILISIYLVFAPFISDSIIGIIIATVLILAGLIFYYPFVRLQKEVRLISEYIQQLNKKKDRSLSIGHVCFLFVVFQPKQANLLKNFSI